MNLLYITKTSPLGDAGGGEKRAHEVMSGLAERGHDIVLLCGKTDPELPKRTTVDGYDVRHVTCIPSLFFRFPTASFYATRYLFAFLSIPVLAWMLLRNEFDAVIENMTPYPTLTVIFAKLARVPIFAIQHEFYDRSCYRTYDPITATIQLLVQNILRVFSYTAIIVPTSHIAKKLEQYGIPRSRIVVIPNGVDVEGYQMSDVEHRPQELVTVGRLSKRKGQHFLLESFEDVLTEYPKAHLHIVGKGPAMDSLMRTTHDLEIQNSVTFHGFVSHERKRELLNTSDIFVFASRQEGFGLVLLEAMAAGLPVVARSLPVYEDFFQDGTNGHLLNSNDQDTFTNMVQRLLEDRDKLESIRSVNERTAKQFSWDSTVDQTEALLIEAT
ncbi:glycosyltransferase family 4 protein [Natronosalvus rutilus]|uniref:Glycosyltransferase family 4 protein n=1 Tax=Natronosalvus rutilus TaxID=2953753 RepID=A0A9E7NCF7_9EURY|nr:glycosyltransferase family 4 protein [Natronosalvus rutilus]UTF54801.1 glycosyltransferase family 4 protein [Natronosalvus rutilus]